MYLELGLESAGKADIDSQDPIECEPFGNKYREG